MIWLRNSMNYQKSHCFRTKRAELINNREAKLKELDALTNKLDEVEASLKQKQALSKTLQEKLLKYELQKKRQLLLLMMPV